MSKSTVHAASIRLPRQYAEVLKSIALIEQKSSSETLRDLVEAARQKYSLPLPPEVTITKVAAKKVSEVSFVHGGVIQKLILDRPKAVALAKAINSAAAEGWRSLIEDIVVYKKGTGVCIRSDEIFVTYSPDAALKIAHEITAHFTPAK